MTKKLQSVKKLKELAEREEMKSLGKLHALLNDEIGKLQMLVKHKEEYSADFVDSREITSESHNLLVQQEFMSNLEIAIAQQKEVIRFNQENLEKQIVAWNKANQELKAIDKYMSKKAEEHAYLLSKNEQKEIDDMISSRLNASSFHQN